MVLIVFLLILFADQRDRTEVHDPIKHYLEKANICLTGDHDSIPDYVKKAYNAAFQTEDDSIISEAVYAIGVFYLQIGFVDSAEVYLNLALEWATGLNDSTLLGKTKNQMARIFWHRSDNIKAKETYEEAIAIHEKQKNYVELGKAYTNLANLYTRWGDYNQAVNLFMQALESYVETDFIEGVAWLNFSMGILYKRVGEYEQALDYVKNALNTYEKISFKTLDSTGIRICYHQLGDLYTHYLDSLELGLKYQLKALRLAEKTQLQVSIADGLAGVGQTYYKMGNLDLAEEYLLRSYNYRVQENMKSGTASNMKFLGLIEKENGNFAKAEDYYKRGYRIAQEINYNHIINDINKAFSELYEKQGKFELSLKYLQRYLALKDSILNTETTNKVASANLKYEIEKKIRENDLLTQQNKIQQLQIEQVRLMRNFLLILVILALLAIGFTVFLYFKQKQIKTLHGLIPICAKCKRIRNDEGYYEKLELYISQHTDADFSHGLCPDCLKELEPELYHIMKKEGSI